MVRLIYTVLLYLALPFIFLRLSIRSFRQPAYRRRWGERLGYYPHQLNASSKCIWLHTVSVGETIAAIPLVRSLMKAYPSISFVMSTMTPTGAERVEAAFGRSVTHVYLPYDTPSAMRRFLRAVNPMVALIMETELWPNLLAACAQLSIPVLLLNARLSPQSARAYQRIPALIQPILNVIYKIAANSEADAARFIALGATKEQVIVTGNLKFDLTLPPDNLEQSIQLRALLGKARPIWIAASTHEGEEAIILTAHAEICRQLPDALLILVPRHPERFLGVAKLSEALFKTQRRSQAQEILPETAVYVGDTMGELLCLYGASDVAFIGGSLVPRGGHNMVEAAALSKPLLSGPFVFNFTEMSAALLQANAMLSIHNADTLAKAILSLLTDEATCSSMGKSAKAIVEANKGALSKQLQLIQAVLADKV